MTPVTAKSLGKNLSSHFMNLVCEVSLCSLGEELAQVDDFKVDTDSREISFGGKHKNLIVVHPNLLHFIFIR